MSHAAPVQSPSQEQPVPVRPSSHVPFTQAQGAQDSPKCPGAHSSQSSPSKPSGQLPSSSPPAMPPSPPLAPALPPVPSPALPPVASPFPPGEDDDQADAAKSRRKMRFRDIMMIRTSSPTATREGNGAFSRPRHTLTNAPGDVTSSDWACTPSSGERVCRP